MNLINHHIPNGQPESTTSAAPDGGIPSSSLMDEYRSPADTIQDGVIPSLNRNTTQTGVESFDEVVGDEYYSENL